MLVHINTTNTQKQIRPQLHVHSHTHASTNTQRLSSRMHANTLTSI